MVSPYPWDVPGGVVAHIRDLAETLQDLGHEVSVMTPVDDDEAPLPAYVVRAGRSIPVPYNGSVARLTFGPVSATRMLRWLRAGQFDVLHVHQPETLSLSLLAVMCADGPIVSTSHAHNTRSRILSLFQTPLQTQLEKVQARIAVSPAARRTIVEHLGHDAVLVPNGVHVHRFALAQPLPGWPGEGGAAGFIGRIDEPRKGLATLLDAFAQLAVARPDLRLLVAGPGDPPALPRSLRDRVVFLGLVSDEDKARFYRSVDVFVAPNTGGESFGIVLLEALAAGTPIVASDLDAFRQVLDDGRAGVLFQAGDPDALVTALGSLLDAPGERERLVDAGRRTVRRYDWSVVAREVVRVYETVIVSGTSVGVDEATVELWASQSASSS
jgi:phosphatidylinositol alpha-mannosyltransferase